MLTGSRVLLVPVLIAAIGAGAWAAVASRDEANASTAGAAATTNGRPIQVTFDERRDKRLKVAVRSVTAGRITFIVENRGRRAHRLVVLKTNRKPRALPLKGHRVRPIGRRGRVFVGPGKTRTLTVTLGTGRYILVGNLLGHYLAGERAKLLVVEPKPVATPTPAPSPPPAPPPPSSAARSLFVQNCGVCHRLADAGTIGGVGPNLDSLRPSKATVVRQVTNGGGGMPAFRGILTPAQIDAIATYVSQVAGR